MNAVVVVDGAQGIVHEPVDVTTLGADFTYSQDTNFYAPGSWCA
ncbi:cysteine desulfurase [Vibrio chagasii]|nr:cysteine desulfurase [Vibrio chagasii]